MLSFEIVLSKVRRYNNAARQAPLLTCIQILTAHFSPAWDGYRLKESPPSRSDLVEWSKDKISDGQLYDYEDMDLVPQWHDEASLFL